MHNIDLDDPLSMNDIVDELGIGTAPSYELPERVVASTPDAHESEYAEGRKRVLLQCQRLIAKNAAISTVGGNCTAPPVKLSVLPEDQHYVNVKPYPIPAKVAEAVRITVAKWLEEKKICLAPAMVKYNSPLLAVLKKDDEGKMTQIRVCIDVRRLNEKLIENDKFVLPFISSALTSLAGKKIFGEIDIANAYMQMKLDPDSTSIHCIHVWWATVYV